MSVFSSLFVLFEIYEIIDYQVRQNSKVSKVNTFFSKCDDNEISFFKKSNNRTGRKVLRNCILGKSIYWFPLSGMKYDTIYYRGELIKDKGKFIGHGKYLGGYHKDD